MDTPHALTSGKGGCLYLINAIQGSLVPNYSSPASAKLT
jgi:hypothetical protein